MLHDPRTMRSLARKMRVRSHAHDAEPVASLPELIARIDAALAARRNPPR